MSRLPRHYRRPLITFLKYDRDSSHTIGVAFEMNATRLAYLWHVHEQSYNLYSSLLF